MSDKGMPVSALFPLRVIVCTFVDGGAMTIKVVPVGTEIVLLPEERVVGRVSPTAPPREIVTGPNVTEPVTRPVAVAVNVTEPVAAI